jgi:uncharacterized protein (DUF305 family)
VTSAGARRALQRTLSAALMCGLLSACGGATTSSGSIIVRPGAPGEPTQGLDAAEVSRVVVGEFTPADVRFMQGMIAHHAQALTMGRLAATRAGSEGVRLLALRIESSQGAEITLVERWLSDRGQETPLSELNYQIPSAAGEPVRMPGMLSEDQIAELEAASGSDFDGLFLPHMIRHHEGALTMIRELFTYQGAARDGEIFRFASDVDSDQRIEIARMVRMLTGSP